MSKKILISTEDGETRVAVLEGKILEELYIERKNQARLVGNIYKGRVRSVVSGIQAAFVDIGLQKQGFLYIADIIPPQEDVAEMLVDGYDEAARRSRPSTGASIHDLVKKGDALDVQIVKEAMGTKGVRLTANISLPGRYLVLMPTEANRGVSRQIEDRKERDRLKTILKQLKVPKGMGAIVRTAGLGKDKRQLERDLKFLVRLWAKIKSQSKKLEAPALSHHEYDLVLKIARDSFSEDVESLTIDIKEEYHRLLQFVRSAFPHMKSKVRFYKDPVPLFEKYEIEPQIEKIFQRTVSLKSGGYIIIEPTESLVAIDVNSGRYTREKDQSRTAFRTNEEAAYEIARQLRLRDLGGIIVIDFIDMKSAKDRRQIYKILEEELAKDKAKTNILSISELGLVEMTRQRVRESLEDFLSQPCPYCHGRGIIKSHDTISIEVIRKIRKILTDDKPQKLILTLHPLVALQLLNQKRQTIVNLEKKHSCSITINEDNRLSLDDMKVEK
ncbi:MAG: Rne/Rng family ribonuclease [Candidatus Omnitrophica bacterium]|nr:Rne/Rng family ribonuclease [Candidatus Omnitrophota bacterium]